jgi:hypothetical protein
LFSEVRQFWQTVTILREHLVTGGAAQDQGRGCKARARMRERKRLRGKDAECACFERFAQMKK